MCASVLRVYACVRVLGTLKTTRKNLRLTRQVPLLRYTCYVCVGIYIKIQARPVCRVKGAPYIRVCVLYTVAKPDQCDNAELWTF